METALLLKTLPKLFSMDFGYWGLQTLAMLLTAFILPNLKIKSMTGALTTVVALAFVNSKLWDAALFLHLPDSFSYHAILLLLANGAIFYILVKILPGIEISGFRAAFLAPLIFTGWSLLIDKYHDQIDWPAVWEYTSNLFSHLKQFFMESELGDKIGKTKVE